MEDRHCSLADHSKSLQTVRIPIKIKVPLDSPGISVSCQTLSPTHHKSNMLCHAKTLPNLYLIMFHVAISFFQITSLSRTQSSLRLKTSPVCKGELYGSYEGKDFVIIYSFACII